MTRLVWANGPRDHVLQFTLLKLADNADDRGAAFPKVSTMAAETRMNEKTIRRALDRLEAEGWVAVQRFERDARRRSYQINLARLTQGAADYLPSTPSAELPDSESGIALDADPQIADSAPGISPADSGLSVPQNRTLRPVNSGLSVQTPRTPYRSNDHRTTRNDHLLAEESPLVLSSPTLPVRRGKGGDARHTPFREALEAYWRYVHRDDGIEMLWDASEAKALAELLKASPQLTLESFKQLLFNRSRSEVNHGDRVRVWIRNITSFASPTDRFKLPATANGRPHGRDTFAQQARTNTLSAAERAVQRLADRPRLGRPGVVSGH